MARPRQQGWDITDENDRCGSAFENPEPDYASDVAELPEGTEPSIGELLRAIATGLGLPNLSLLISRQILLKFEGCLPLLLWLAAAARSPTGHFRLLGRSFRWRYFRQ